MSDQACSNMPPYAVKPKDSDLMDLIRLLDLADRYDLYQALNMSQRDIETAEANSPPYAGVDIKAIAVLAKWREKNSKMATQQALLDGLERCGNVEAKENIENMWIGKDSLADVNRRSASEKSEMYDIIKPLGTEELLRLYQSLDLLSASIERAENRVQSTDVHQRARSVIRWWKKRKGKKATCEVLQTAVKSCRYMPRQATQEMSTDPSTWRKQLQALYRSKRSGIGFLPGSFEEFPSDEYFVDLQLAKEQKTPTQVKHLELKTYTDLLTLSDEKGNDLKHVYVSGLAGMGKTTMMSRLAFLWASVNQSMNPLHVFQQVFLIDLRKTTPDMDLLDAICSQLLGNISRHKLEEYLTKNAHKCLYLFDGFDELSVKDTMVLKSQLLNDSHVIVTTRPNKVVKFQEIHQNYVQVNMEGFTEESIKRFIENFFRSTCETNRTSDLLSKIGSNYVIDNLKRFPLLLGMVCIIWREKQSLPQTVSNLYHQVIEFLLRHWKAREAEGSADLSSEKFKDHVQFDQVMASIGKTALHGLLNDSTLVFKEDEFESHEIIKHGSSLGILSSESKISGFDRMTYVSFIHKTFQEYSAALYLANLADSNETLFKTLLSQMDFDDMEYVLRFCCGRSHKAAKLILNFDVELPTGDSTWESGVNWSKRDSCGLLFILLFETECAFGMKGTLHNILRPSVHTITMYMNKYRYDPVYSAALQYIVTNFEKHHAWTNHVKMITVIIQSVVFSDRNDILENQLAFLQKLCLRKINFHVIYLPIATFEINIEAFQTLTKYLNRLPLPVDELTLGRAVALNLLYVYMPQIAPNATILNVASIKIDRDTKPEEVTHVLQDIHSRLGSIKEMHFFQALRIIEILKYAAPFYNMLLCLKLNSLGLSQEGIDTMFEDMLQSTKLSSLEEFSLQGNCINSSHAKALTVLLKQMPMLRKLELGNNKLGCQGVIAMSESFHYTTQLEEINFENNDIGYDGVKSLASVLHHTTELRLSKNTIKCDGAKAIASALKSNTSLRDLHLDHNQIECDGAKAIASALESNTSLRYLYLHHNQIQCDGANAIASALKSNTSLKYLYLSHNQIECKGAKAIASALESNTSLGWLQLDHNQIKSDGAKSLAAAALQSSNVEYLHLDGNQIGSDDVEALRSAAENAGIHLRI